MGNFDSAVRQRLKQQLSAHEGRRADVYDDATGKRITQGTTVQGHPTVGIGHNLDASPLCDEAVDAQYQHDMSAVVDEITKAMPWTIRLDGACWRVLADICFNTGFDGLLGFHKMLAAMQKGDKLTAAAEVEDSALAPYRRAALASLLRA